MYDLDHRRSGDKQLCRQAMSQAGLRFDARASRSSAAEFCESSANRRSRRGHVFNRLFEVAPQLKAMFPTDMDEQRRKLMATLGLVVNGLSNLESVLPATSALAKRHVAYGTKPEQYPVVGSALL